MKRVSLILLLLFLYAIPLWAQVDTAASRHQQTVFERVRQSMAQFKPDTSAVPDDKVTRKIEELRRLGGGFNIGEAIAFKLEEDRQNGSMPPQQLDSLASFFRSGNGQRWLNNAVNHIYRNYFSYKELKQLVRFYKTSAGQKLATDLPLIMLQSMAAAEMLKNTFMQQKGKQ